MNQLEQDKLAGKFEYPTPEAMSELDTLSRGGLFEDFADFMGDMAEVAGRTVKYIGVFFLLPGIMLHEILHGLVAKIAWPGKPVSIHVGYCQIALNSKEVFLEKNLTKMGMFHIIPPLVNFVVWTTLFMLSLMLPIGRGWEVLSVLAGWNLVPAIAEFFPKIRQSEYADISRAEAFFGRSFRTLSNSILAISVGILLATAIIPVLV